MGSSNPPLSELPDLDLIARYRETKDNTYVGILFHRHKHQIVGVCMKYLKDQEDAKDASMDIFEELLVKLLAFEVKNFKSWVHTVARNHCLMKIRKKKGFVEVDVQNEKIENQLMESPDFEHLVDVRQDDHELLLEAIAQLKDGQRECIILFYLEELSYKEIADKLQLDLKQVKSNIQNGKRNLQMILTQALND